MDSVTCAIALGANLGDRHATLSAARMALSEHIRGLGGTGFTASRAWETVPVGPPQPAYLNAVVVFSAPAALDAETLMDWLLAQERLHGRERRERWGPRTLDLDILVVGDRRQLTPHLSLPHPHAHERAFVLWPWLDADPFAILPGRGRVDLLAAALGTAGAVPVLAANAW